jgi:hypothetical protein
VSTEGKKEGPSLSKPRGAVDAVGTRLVAGVQGLSLGGLMGRVVGGNNHSLGSNSTASGPGGGTGQQPITMATSSQNNVSFREI